MPSLQYFSQIFSSLAIIFRFFQSLGYHQLISFNVNYGASFILTKLMWKLVWTDLSLFFKG